MNDPGYDLIVIGGGEAGISAALRAAGLGARTAMINREPELGGGESLEVDRIMIGVGRRPNTEALNLAPAGIEAGGRGEIPVDEHMETSAPGIYAAGDILARIMLSSTAVVIGKCGYNDLVRGCLDGSVVGLFKFLFEPGSYKMGSGLSI